MTNQAAVTEIAYVCFQHVHDPGTGNVRLLAMDFDVALSIFLPTTTQFSSICTERGGMALLPSPIVVRPTCVMS